MSKSNFSGSAKKSKSRRLGGGPTLPPSDTDYWRSEMRRVAEAEGLSKCYFPTLLRRIARAKLDLTLAGIARYVALDGRRDAHTEPEPVLAARYS